MKITDIRVFPVNEQRLKAYVSITLNDCFVIRDLKIINGTHGLFVSMPSKKNKAGRFKDVAHPLNSETRNMIESAVFKVYKKELKSLNKKYHHHERKVA